MHHSPCGRSAGRCQDITLAATDSTAYPQVLINVWPPPCSDLDHPIGAFRPALNEDSGALERGVKPLHTVPNAPAAPELRSRSATTRQRPPGASVPTGKKPNVIDRI